MYPPFVRTTRTTATETTTPASPVIAGSSESTSIYMTENLSVSRHRVETSTSTTRLSSTSPPPPTHDQEDSCPLTSPRRTLPPHRAIPARIPKPYPDDRRFVNRPTGGLALFLWKKQIWLESTFALTVCEPWEEVAVLTIFAILAVALFIALAVYLPRQLVVMQKRAVYYLWGEEINGESLGMTSSQAL